MNRITRNKSTRRNVGGRAQETQRAVNRTQIALTKFLGQKLIRFPRKIETMQRELGKKK